MGISSAKEMYKAKWLGITWQALSLSGAACVGLVAIAYFPNGLVNEELIFVEMVKGIFSPFWMGIILCGVLAATISTMDSQILVASGVLSEDFYRKRFHPEASPKALLRATRIGVLVVSLVALLISFAHTSRIFDLVLYAWSGLGCSFGPLILSALHSSRVNRNGAIAGLITGGVITALWPILASHLPCEMPAMIPGFILSLGMIHLVSRMTEPHLA
jgi:Na+/proline symporter